MLLLWYLRDPVQPTGTKYGCGIAINPDTVRAQMKGGIGTGLGAALREAVTLKEGAIEQINFDRYQPLRIDKMPRVEVHIAASRAAPSGVGEPGVPPIAPAVANVLCALTWKPVRRLPFVQHTFIKSSSFSATIAPLKS